MVKWILIYFMQISNVELSFHKRTKTTVAILNSYHEYIVTLGMHSSEDTLGMKKVWFVPIFTVFKDTLMQFHMFKIMIFSHVWGEPFSSLLF